MLLILADLVVFGPLAWAVTTYLEPTSTGGLVLFLVAVVVVFGLLLLTLLALFVATLVIHVAGLLAARAGRWYVPPLCWRFVKGPGVVSPLPARFSLPAPDPPPTPLSI